MWPEIKASGNLEDFRRFGHTIKGSFLQFGFSALSKVGREMMDDAERADWNAAEIKISGLIVALNEIKNRWC